MVGFISDAVGLYEKFGLGWVLSLVLLTLILIWLWRIIKRQSKNFKDRFSRFDEDLNIVKKSFLTKDGRIISKETEIELLIAIKNKIDSFSENSQDYFTDADTIASQEHWKNCPIDRCPNMSLLLNELKDLINQVVEFKNQTEEYRRKNDSLINNLITRIDAMLIEVIAFLKALVKKQN